MSASNNAPDSTWNVGYFSTFSEIAGTKVSLDQFMRELCTFRRSDVIKWAGTLLQIVSAPFGQTVEVQEELIGLCLDGTLAINASRIVHGDGRQVVFHRRQLWLLIQFASIVCNENGIPIANLCNTFGRLCLIASDCLHSIQLAQCFN